MKTTFFFILILLTTCFTELRAQNTNPDDPLNGLKKEYYPSGKLSKEYTVENGVPNGIVKTYSEKGFIISEQEFVQGVPNGIMKTFYENGKIHYENNFKDGMPQGTSKEYYDSGTLKIDSYLTGEPWAYSGFTNIYFENGTLKSESKFSEGKLMTATTYDKEGRVTSEQKDGQVISYWYENNGKRHVSINGVPQD